MTSSETLPTVVDQGTDVAHIDRELDANVASSVNAGVWTREEAQRHYGYTAEDMDRALAPPMSLVSVNKELSAIDRLRRTDKRAYYSNEKIQQEERRLISLREKLKAQAMPTTKEDSDYDGSALDPDLLSQWERQGGVAYHLKTAQDAARVALDTLEPDEAQADLIEEWGRDAPKKLGIVRGRIRMMLNAMKPADRSRAEVWLDSLPTSHAKAVFKALVG